MEPTDGIARVESLVEELEGLGEPARSLGLDTVGALLELYGEGLRRILAAVPDPETLAEDDLVAHLLLLHDLHPVPLETRVGRALDEVRPYLESHGGGVELLSLSEGVAHLRLEGTCNGCPSSTATMRLAIEEALQRAAPELERIDAEGLAEPPQPALVQLGSFGRDRSDAAWTAVGALRADGPAVRVQEVAGDRLLFVSIDGTFYAYREGCPSCSAELAESHISDGELLCEACFARFDVRRAGRCLDRPELSLEPVPLLVDDAGLVKVALPVAVAR